MEPSRQHYWDSIRGYLMLLGVPFHAALPYHSREVWFVMDGDRSAVLTAVADALHFFRMHAFFLMAGYFASMLLAKRGPGPWFRSRLTRVGVPLLFGLVVICPIQASVMGLPFLFRGEPVPPLIGADGLLYSDEWTYRVMHLWFLIVLLYYTGLTAALARVGVPKSILSLLNAMDDRLGRRPYLYLLAVVAAVTVYEIYAPGLLNKAGLNDRFTIRLLRAPEFMVFAPFFALGFCLYRFDGLFAAFTRRSLPVLAVALGSLALAVVLKPVGGKPATVAATVAAVLVAQGIVALARAHLDRPSGHVSKLVSYSFTIYLLHIIVIGVLASVFALVHLPPVLEFAAVVAITIAVTAAAARAVAASPVANFLLNGVPPRGVRAPEAAIGSARS